MSQQKKNPPHQVMLFAPFFGMVSENVTRNLSGIMTCKQIGDKKVTAGYLAFVAFFGETC